MASQPHSLSGVLVVDKPEGPTSHDIVTLARRALGISRIGHTGTLDPLATGVLPLVLGPATRLAQFLTASEKSYDATLVFGRSTDTYDVKGRQTSTSDLRPSRSAIETALAGFRGRFEQTPPAYSAKNIDGERAYELARKGKDSRPHPSAVTAHRLELVEYDGERVRLSMDVSAGFYVRSLAHDLGAALGCGAVLSALRRTRSGEFDLRQAVPLDEVLRSSRDSLAARIVPPSALLPAVPAVTLRSDADVERVRNGVEMGPGDVLAPLDPLPPLTRMLAPDGRLVALAKPGLSRGFLHGWVVLG
jgi:tRNA pseudouridine55 synthase